MELYSEMRSRIKNGDLLIWKIKKVGTFTDMFLLLIQKIFKTNYSHVGIALVYGERIFCLEASYPVVRLVPLSDMNDFYIIHAKVKWKKEHESILLSAIGKPYSLIDFIKISLGFKPNNTDYYCSELLSAYYNKVGYLDNENAGLRPDILVEEVSKVSGNDPIFIKLDGEKDNGL